MIFGGIAGINWFDPATIHPNPYKAIPAISAIYVNDRLMAADTAVFMRALTLPYTQNTISLSLRALEFTKNEDNQFAYKLDGLEQQWVVTNNDKARYSSLPPGNYTFLLKVSNNEGIWNETPLRLNVVILPPYWQTWWFYTLVSAFCLGIVSLVVRQYVRQKVVSKTRELEKQQALYRERLRISKDVHDDLGSGLSKISLMADVAQGKAADNGLLRQDIKNISDISRELVDNMRDLIWVLHPDNTTLDVLVARLREYCADYLDNMPIAVMLNFPEKVPAYTLSREAQRNIFLTVKEAINNCVKHSGATQITIALALLPDHINITLSDNGKGFDNKMLKSTGNGLRNMRQRIELIGGEFQISSGEGGTTITIRVCYGCLKNENNTFV
jgi:signal transduction histidine kinase